MNRRASWLRPALVLASLPLVLLQGGELPAEEPARGQVEVTVTGFRNERGVLRVALFRGEAGFPGDPSRARRTATVRIREGQSSASFSGLPAGVYALSVLHDENSNGKMDTNWIGIPREGGGASRNPKVRFGPPDFEEANFRVRDRMVSHRIKLRYP